MKTPAAIHSELDDAGLTAEQFRVMAHVCRRFGDGDNQRQCDASIESMARVCKLREATVRKALRELCKLGWLDSIDRPGFTKVHVPRFPHPFRLELGVAFKATTANGNVSPQVGGVTFEATTISAAPDPSTEGEGRLQSGGERFRLEPAEGIPSRDSKKGNVAEALPFESETFKAAWTDWKQHRREIKKGLTPTSAKQQLKTFSEWGEERSIAAMRHTIGNGWQGLREPETPLKTPAHQSPKTRDLNSSLVGI